VITICAKQRPTLTAIAAACIVMLAALPTAAQKVTQPAGTPVRADASKLIETYCFDCHDDVSKEGDLDLISLLETSNFDGAPIFEKLITAKMPPDYAEQPSPEERRLLLNWLANRQEEEEPNAYRRLSRHEFVSSINDLIGTNLELAETIPEDRGTYDFDSDRRIMLTKEMLGAYFAVADEMLQFAFPEDGILQEQIWTTSKIKDSHHTYNIYVRDYKEGLLFSWTRANNGNSYSFFYDNFDPPATGWYDLRFDAAKLGDFKEDVSLQVFAGKYYFADDRPQPQRLLGVISLGNRELESHTIRVFLHPGENVSVHCYSKHTWRQKGGQQGAYIKQLRAQGPVFDQWPPKSYQTLFAGLALDWPPRETREVSDPKTALEQMGGKIAVSSFQQGMEKEKMLDGSNRTFWHTRFEPTLAKPPHYVILENPAGKQVAGLSYATWSGGNGNGQVEGYAIYVSDDGENWANPIVEGRLEARLAAEQKILFPAKTSKRFIKFLVTDAISLDGKSLASVGKLDVLAVSPVASSRTTITVSSQAEEDLKKVIRRFAEKAFSSTLTEVELEAYYQVGLNSLQKHGDFVQAAKVGLKAVLCSHRFLLAPGVHSNGSYRAAADLARWLWLSVPDQRLLDLSSADRLTAETIRAEIDRMLDDERGRRMIHSFCAQWLNLRSFNKVSPSLKLYPAYDDLLNHYLPLETEAYLLHLIQQNLPVSHLIDSDFSILNQRLAQHYGVDGVIGQQMRQVSFQPDSPRGGLLTMGSVLMVTTDGFNTSPILRGAWISKNIAGNTLSPPPEDVKAIERTASTAVSLREQIDEHKNNDTCYACHKSIDSYGFALENFNPTGQWRTNYRVEKPHSGTFQYRLRGYFDLAGDVDASGDIDDIDFDDVVGLKNILLANQKNVAYNLAKKLFEYANGYKPTLSQRVALYGMIPENAEKCRMKDLITEVLTYSLAGDRG
jgi:hypothetical protein